MKLLKFTAIILGTIIVTVLAIYVNNNIRNKNSLADNKSTAEELISLFEKNENSYNNMVSYLSKIDTCSEFFNIYESNRIWSYKNDFTDQEILELASYFKGCENPEQQTCCNANSYFSLSYIRDFMMNFKIHHILINRKNQILTIRFKQENSYPTDMNLEFKYLVGKELMDTNSIEEINNRYNWKIKINKDWYLTSERINYR